MILDTIPDKLSGILPSGGGDTTILVYESTSAFDGTTGTSWIIINQSYVFIFSTPPLGDIESANNFAIRDVSAIKSSKSILGDIRIEFFLKADQQPFVFILPSLVLHDWEALSVRFQKIFGDVFHPDVTDSSFGSDSLISSSSVLSLAGAQEILFKPINSVKVDDSRMQSRLDTTMAGLDDQINVQVTDESGHEPLKPQAKQAIAAANKQKKLRKTPQTNLVPDDGTDAGNRKDLVTCPRCKRKNLPDYDYCLGCGQEIESQKNKAQRKTGKPSDYGYSSHGTAQAEEASGCLTQLFYFIIGAGALLFFISLGK